MLLWPRSVPQTHFTWQEHTWDFRANHKKRLHVPLVLQGFRQLLILVLVEVDEGVVVVEVDEVHKFCVLRRIIRRPAEQQQERQSCPRMGLLPRSL